MASKALLKATKAARLASFMKHSVHAKWWLVGSNTVETMRALPKFIPSTDAQKHADSRLVFIGTVNGFKIFSGPESLVLPNCAAAGYSRI